jgi:excisionase family DNA binding protein
MVNNMEVLLTVKQLQDYLQISRTKVYQLIGTTGFPKIQIGKEYRIPQSRLEQWLKAHEV